MPCEVGDDGWVGEEHPGRLSGFGDSKRGCTGGRRDGNPLLLAAGHAP
jgi:hypothetical protein